MQDAGVQFNFDILDDDLGPLLLSWIKFNPRMYKYSHTQVWDDITYPFLNLNGCAFEFLEMDMLFYTTLRMTCDYLYMPGLVLRISLFCSKRNVYL